MTEEQVLRQWLVDQGHIPPEARDTVALHICRTGHGEADMVSPPHQQEDEKMSDKFVNRAEVEGIVKWEPRVFEPREDGQKLIMVFAIEQPKGKTDKKQVFRCKVFGDTAEKLKDERLDIGDRVRVEGILNENKWKDKQTDEWKDQIEIWPSKVEFVERADGGGDGDFGGGSSDAEDDDIPF